MGGEFSSDSRAWTRRFRRFGGVLRPKMIGILCMKRVALFLIKRSQFACIVFFLNQKRRDNRCL